MNSMKFSNFTFDKIKPHIDDVIAQHAKYVKSDDLIGYLAFINRNEIVSWGCPISWSMYQDEKDAVNTRSHITSPQLSFYDFDLYITPNANKNILTNLEWNLIKNFANLSKTYSTLCLEKVTDISQKTS